MTSGRLALQARDARWRQPAAYVLRPLAVLLAVVALSGCESMSQKFADGLSQAPAIGLPADAPERPAEPIGYPAVHDIPPPRNSVTLTSLEQQKMEDDLLAARDQQQAGVGMKAQPKSKRQERQERVLKGLPPVKQAQPGQPIVPASSRGSIY